MQHSRRESIEEHLVECWRAYEQADGLDRMQASKVYRRDICFHLALLLNTYLESDTAVDWRGTWADRLVDEVIDSALSATRTARGLMVFGKLGVSSMHIVPFSGSFKWPVDAIRPESYELWFAAKRPWDSTRPRYVVPYTRDHQVRRQLLELKIDPREDWVTVYDYPIGSMN